MADRKIEVVIAAADEFSKTLNDFKTSLDSTADKVDSGGSRMQTRFDSVGGSIAGVHAAWIKLAGVVAAAAWFIDAGKQALASEESMNRLRIQVNALGLDYASLKGQIDIALESSARYAAVQDDEVASVFKQLLFLTGDYTQSIQNLNLVFDLAYQKEVSHSEAATLVGKAMTGNIEALGRLIPEFKNLDDSLGKNATTAEKAALAMDLLRGKVAGATGEMSAHARQVAEATLVYTRWKEAIGDFLLGFPAFIEGMVKMGGITRALEPVSHAIDVLAGKLNDNIVVSSKAASTAINELTHPVTELFNQGLVDAARNTGKLVDELDRFKARMDKMSDQSALGGSAFTAMFSPVSLSAGTIDNPIMKALKGEPLQKEDKTPLPESDADTWEAEMERIIAAKEREATAITGYDELIAQGAQARSNITGKAYEAVQDQMLSLIETGKFSLGAMAKIIAQQVKMELTGIAARAAVWAIFETAMGLGKAAVGDAKGAALHFASAGEFAITAGVAFAGAAAVHGLFGGTAERSAPGTVGGEPIRVSDSGFLPSSTQIAQTQHITVIIHNPLSEQNWAKITEDNIVPAINAAGDRNVKISVNAVGA